MRIIIRSFDGCPHRALAEDRLGKALAAEEIEADVIREVVGSDEEAEDLGFEGSPTFLFDGTDPFVPSNARPSLTCRLYATPDGLEGSPSVDALRAVIRAHAV